MWCRHEQGRQSLLPCWWLNLRVYAVIWLLKWGRRLVMGSAMEQHRGSGVPAETSPRHCFGEGETKLWICKTNVMICSKCFIPNTSNTRHFSDLWQVGRGCINSPSGLYGKLKYRFALSFWHSFQQGSPWRQVGGGERWSEGGGDPWNQSLGIVSGCFHGSSSSLTSAQVQGNWWVSEKNKTTAAFPGKERWKRIAINAPSLALKSIS